MVAKVAEKIPEKVTPKMKEYKLVESPLHDQLNSAAKVIMSQMPEGFEGVVGELALGTYGVHPWQILAGILMNAFQNNGMAHCEFRPEWDMPVALPRSSAVCPQCKQTFSPKHLGQKFCTSKCGGIFAKAQRVVK
ncbi:MAG: hypothetical protein WC449_05580 [Candidatus Paceibacterota bacterium]